MRVVAVLTVVGTALAAAYLLRVLYRLWHGDPAPAPEVSEPGGRNARPRSDKSQRADASPLELAVTIPLVVATTVLGLLPWLLLDLTAPAVHLLLGRARAYEPRVSDERRPGGRLGR